MGGWRYEKSGPVTMGGWVGGRKITSVGGWVGARFTYVVVDDQGEEEAGKGIEGGF